MERKASIEWHIFFLKYMLIIGSILLFLIPPLQAPDETVHFFNAYGFMEGDFYPEYRMNTYTGRIFPKDIIEYATYWDEVSHSATGEDKVELSEVIEQSWENHIDYQDVEFKEYWASVANMIAYVFSGGSMLLCKILFGFFGLDATPYNLMISGRAGNLFFYIAIIYYAIKIAPAYKRTLIALAMMPMCVFQSATLSYDAILIPCCFLLFALMLKYIMSEVMVSKKDFILMCLTSIILFNVKTVYAPFLLGLAFIPKKQFGGVKQYFIAGAIVICCGVGCYMLNKTMLSLNLRGFENAYQPGRTQQTQYLLSHLVGFWENIYNSVRAFGRHYWSSFVGNIGILRLKLPQNILLPYSLLLIFLSLLESNCGKIFTLVQRMILSFVAVLILYASFAGIYISWTSIGHEIGVHWVDGMQGRYFIPIAIFVPLIFSHRKIEWKHMPKLDSIADGLTMYAVTFVPILTVIFEILRFWSI